MFEFNVAGIPSSVVSENRHQASFPCSRESGFHRAVIACQIRVTIDREKGWSELRDGAHKSARSAEGVLSIPGVIDIEAKVTSASNKALDLFTQISEAEDGARDSQRTQQPKLMSDKRFSTYGYEGLWEGGRNRVKRVPKPPAMIAIGNISVCGERSAQESARMRHP